MINDQLSYRVFIEKSELLRLRKIEKLYNEEKDKKENANFTNGGGDTFPVDPQPCVSGNNNTDTTDQRDGPIIKKDFINSTIKDSEERTTKFY